jgi:hypothetical protein
MAVLPVLDGLALDNVTMFEKPIPVPASFNPTAGAMRAAPSGSAERFESRGPRRTGDALRAVAWSEITAKLKASRDLRLLLRTEAQSPIDVVGASFGDAAASYFALLDNSEPGVNPDALEPSKALDGTSLESDANRPGAMAGNAPVAARDVAREMQ